MGRQSSHQLQKQDESSRTCRGSLSLREGSQPWGPCLPILHHHLGHRWIGSRSPDSWYNFLFYSTWNIPTRNYIELIKAPSSKERKCKPSYSRIISVVWLWSHNDIFSSGRWPTWPARPDSDDPGETEIRGLDYLGQPWTALSIHFGPKGSRLSILWIWKASFDY